MNDKRKIVDALGDADGDITHVKLDGSTRFIPAEQAFNRAERGEIENTHLVRPLDGRKPHLRTNPNRRRSDNLDDMVGDS